MDRDKSVSELSESEIETLYSELQSKRLQDKKEKEWQGRLAYARKLKAEPLILKDTVATAYNEYGTIGLSLEELQEVVNQLPQYTQVQIVIRVIKFPLKDEDPRYLKPEDWE